MSLCITCPNCQARCLVNEADSGKLLRCGKCDKSFRVSAAARGPAGAVKAPQPERATPRQSPPPAPPEKEVRQVARVSRAREDDALRPRPGKDRGPSPSPRQPPKSNLPLILGLGGGGLALVALAVVLVIVLRPGGGDGVPIEGNEMRFIWGGNNVGAHARYLVDPENHPGQIEVIYTVGSERYHRRIGIYRLEGDRLELCLSNLDEENRPSRFAGRDQPGGGNTYMVYRREPYGRAVYARLVSLEAPVPGRSRHTRLG
jgi:uncharacterized protein (TIGR03067 family)/predicted Zn finger-like uncharacterized protein